MSMRRLAQISTVPAPIKKAFRTAEDPLCGEERLWRERAARMTLDALGHTNLTVKPHDHNAAVRYARRWFRGMINTDGAPETFDAAGVVFGPIRTAVLATSPILFDPEEDDEPENDTGDVAE